jgi:hypothetical protein
MVDDAIRNSSNSQNTAKGRYFQMLASHALEKHFETTFDKEVSIEIGNPPKDHAFDLASSDGQIIVECKNYSWTASGNVPSAKLTTLDQAVWYFSFLHDRKCVLIMRRATHSKHHETLAEYYYRIHGHLLRDVMLFELGIETEKLRIF